MKTLIIAAAAASLLAAPAAFAQEAAASATASAKPVTTVAPNPAKRTFKVGQSVGLYAGSFKYAVTEPEKLGLDKPGQDQRWMKVETNAYLIDSRTDKVLTIVPLKE